MKSQKHKICLILFILCLPTACLLAASPCQIPLDGDLNRDCKVNMTDFAWFASFWLEDRTNQPGAFLPDGVYVTSAEWGGSNHGSCGTINEPCASIDVAMQRAQQRVVNHVFVADGTYNETVTLVDGINLWGGFNPVTWVRSEPQLSRTVLIGTPGPHAKTIVAHDISHQTTEVSGFQIKGLEAEQAQSNSYAIWIRDCDSNLLIQNNRIIAGRGGDGTDGSDGADGTDGSNGQPGVDAKDTTYYCYDECAADLGETAGGAGGVNSEDATSLNGGNGADALCPDWDEATDNCSTCSSLTANQTTFADGADGDNNPSNFGIGGAGGFDMFQDYFCAGDCNVYIPDGPTVGQDGYNGANGNDGHAGMGASDSTGTITFFEWMGYPGTGGMDGTSGGGGGGGGAGGGVEHYPDTESGCEFGGSDLGGSGGGGGAGGERGTGGEGGTAGGGAFAIFIANTVPSVDAPAIYNNIITPGRGGDGGNGGFGGQGGPGGIGGPGGLGGTTDYDWAAGEGGTGGNGGSGGHGGGGGGGTGGGSYGIYTWNLTGTINYHALNTFDGIGTGGSGGRGGRSLGNDGTEGQQGVALNYYYD